MELSDINALASRRTVGAARCFVKRQNRALRLNLKLAKENWGQLPKIVRNGLKELTTRYALSVVAGDLQFLDGHWYVTHAGLLRIAQRRRCSGIRTVLQKELSDPAANRWVFKATVYKTTASRGFVGYGDADPSNVSPLLRGSELRIGETRAISRALRRAFGIGVTSFEELGWLTGSPRPVREQRPSVKSPHSNGSSNGQPRLRDRLCLLIRQYNLDPILVKAYAADFCGTPTLKEASRELVESFIVHLDASAKENRETLLCKLNSYAQPVEVKL
jgi:hypothetical protein